MRQRNQILLERKASWVHCAVAAVFGFSESEDLRRAAAASNLVKELQSITLVVVSKQREQILVNLVRLVNLVELALGRSCVRLSCLSLIVAVERSGGTGVAWTAAIARRWSQSGLQRQGPASAYLSPSLTASLACHANL
jgi:hypothetical protein